MNDEDEAWLATHQLQWREVAEGKRKRAAVIDTLYDYVDNLMLSDQFDRVNAMYEAIDVKEFPTVALLCFAIHGFPFRDIVPAYRKLCDRAHAIMVERGRTKELGIMEDMRGQLTAEELIDSYRSKTKV